MPLPTYRKIYTRYASHNHHNGVFPFFYVLIVGITPNAFNISKYTLLYGHYSMLVTLQK